MDCCIPIIIVCGSRSFIRRKDPKDNLKELVKEVYYCHSCRCHRRAAVFKRNDWFTICWIPLIPCHLGDPYLGCDACKRPLDVNDIGHGCIGCGTINNQRNRRERRVHNIVSDKAHVQICYTK